MNLKKNGTLLSFFNQPKPILVLLTMPSILLLQSPALPQKSAPNTVATHGDAHIPSTTPFGISPFIKKLSNLAKNLPDSIPEASDSDKLVKFGQDLANFNNKMFDKDSLWKEETNLCLKHVLGWGTEGNMKDLVQW